MCRPDPVGSERFWGVWNRLPFTGDSPETRNWLKSEEEQLADLDLFWQTIRRVLLRIALGQRRYHLNRIPPDARRILWIHLTDHLGDSLMRLSPVQLLADREVDLLASRKAASLFQEEGLFQRIYSIPEEGERARENHYDLVILDALQTKPLVAKYRIQPQTPFVTQNDLFHYCRDDYNLILCSWYRMAYLLNKGFVGMDKGAKLVMDYDPGDAVPRERSPIPSGAVGIAIGGREEYRIYPAWEEVVSQLLELEPDRTIVLLGTENGEATAARIARRHGASIINFVNGMTIRETAGVIAQCQLLGCADGGLLHVANAVGTPTVCLFAQEYPRFRYVPSDSFRALRSRRHVNTIQPEQVVSEIREALSGNWNPWGATECPD